MGCGVIDNAWAQYYELHINPKVDLVVGCIIPFSILLLSNIAIVIKLAIIKKRNLTQGHNEDAGKVQGLTLMLLGVCLVFFVCNFPIWIILTNLRRWMLAAQVTGDISDVADLHLYVAIAVHIYYMNFAVNFFIYIVSAPRFRKDLRRMLCVWRCSSSNQIEASSTASNTTRTGTNTTVTRSTHK